MTKSVLVKDLSKNYDSRGIAGVYDLNFEIKNKEIIALVGPSGCGKTTTLNLLARKLSADSGEIQFPKSYKVALFEKVESLDFSKTILENLKFKAIECFEVDEDKAINLARENLMALEITNEMRKTPSDVSAGQLQRVLLALTLIQRPNLILLDEPFNNLDHAIKVQFINELNKLQAEFDFSMIWVTHDLSLVYEHCQKVMIMNFGKIVQEGYPFNVYLNPSSLFCAQYLGVENILVGKNNNGVTKLPFTELKTPSHLDSAKEDLLLLIRAENIKISSEGSLTGKKTKEVFLGDKKLIHFTCKGHKLKLATSPYTTTEDNFNFDIVLEQITILSEI
ncbi:MAG: ABC-type sugar transport system ATPase subunit [Thermoproteota archaeon]|jgi:ABC-type sugar transport system ATPase subunit